MEYITTVKNAREYQEIGTMVNQVVNKGVNMTKRSELGKWEGIKKRGGRQKELVSALKFRVWELEAQLNLLEVAYAYEKVAEQILEAGKNKE